MIDLLIVNPSASHGIYGPLGDSLIAVEPPLWCRLLAGYLQRRGYLVRILDAEALHLDGKASAEMACYPEYRAQLVCVAVYGHQPSASTQQMWGARQFCAEFVKRRDGDVPIIMVGGHPSALPKRTIDEEIVDYVALGEGPVTVEKLLEADEEDSIPGLVWRDYKDAVHINPSAPLLDLAELDGNVWNQLPMHAYRSHNWQCFGDLAKRQPYASIYTSLGCPYKCSFCCINAPFQSNRYRMRRPRDVVDEIELLHTVHGVSTIKITDEMFVLNVAHYTEICKELIARGLGDKLNIWAYARVDTVKPETLSLLHAAGIRWLALGIESASDEVRDGALKKLKTNDIVGTVRAIQKAGINVIGNFMFGLPGDDMATMQKTLDLALKCLPDFANFYSTMAYPGSSLYEQAVKNGWRLPASWRGYSQHNEDCTPLDTEYVEGRTVLDFRDRSFTNFYSSPRYLDHVKHKFGQETEAHIHEMLKYHLKRKLLESAA